MKIVISSEKIEAKSLISTIKDVLNKLSDGWMKLVDKLGLDKDGSPMQISDAKELDNGGYTVMFKIIDGDTTADASITLQPLNGKAENAEADKWEVFGEASNNNAIFKNFKKFTGTREQCESKQADWVEVAKAALDKNIIESPNSAVRFAASRVPIKGSKEDSIELVAINANYEICEALDHVNSVLSNDAVVDMLPSDGTPIQFDVAVADDTLNVCPSPEPYTGDFNKYELLQELIKELVVMEFNFKTIQWNVSGNGAEQIRNFVRSISWSIESDVDFVASISHIMYGIVTNPLSIASKTFELIQPNLESCKICPEEAIRMISAMLYDYQYALENVYVGFSDDIIKQFLDIRFRVRNDINRFETMLDDTKCGSRIDAPLFIQTARVEAV